MAKITDRLAEFKDRMSSDLRKCVDFWLQYSEDKEYGGFFTCLDRKGELYDETKYGWMQGRQVWTYAWLYNESQTYKVPELLAAAERGAEFMMKHLRAPDNYKCYFSVTRDGRPLKIQRTIFTETFYVMAMAELARATAQAKYKTEALAMMDAIIHWVRTDSSGLGRPQLSGMEPVNVLAVPMMLLCVIDVFVAMDTKLLARYRELIEWCVTQTLAHVQRDGNFILETVSADDRELGGCEGRRMNPGHAIEGGWFLLKAAKLLQDEQLKEKAIKHFIQRPMQYGWDEQHGGFFSFMDVDNKPLTQLEWDMKLWWAHNEAMIALLMAYEETRDPQHLEEFGKVYDYSMKHFSDPEYGEWLGYLSRKGEVTLNIKGGPFKGCFHVPRCLLMCEQILSRLLNETQ